MSGGQLHFCYPYGFATNRHTSLSAPSIHTNLAFLLGRALRIRSAMATPVNKAVETPAAPHEKPLLFLTWFCSFLRLPAQTSVMGQVICSYSAISWRRVMVIGFSTSLPSVRQNPSIGRKTIIIPLDTELPVGNVCLLDFGYCSMVSHVEELGAC